MPVNSAKVLLLRGVVGLTFQGAWNSLGVELKKRTQVSLNQPPDQANVHTGNGDSISVLHELAKSLGGQVRKKVVHLYGGTTLTRQLRVLYRGHKIELLANEDLTLADVEASYGRFELLQINPISTRFQLKPARTTNTSSAKHVILTFDGNLSGPQSELYESGVLGRFLDVVDPHEGEEINVSQRLVRVYLQRPNLNRVMATIHAVIDLMPHDERAPAEFAAFPDALRPLVPLLAKWAIDDDDERSRKLKRCAQSTRQKLVDAVVPLLPAIDDFLGKLIYLVSASYDAIAHAKQRDYRAHFHCIGERRSAACESLVRLRLERFADDPFAECNYKRVIADEDDSIL